MSALNNVDLPTLGKPTIPIFKFKTNLSICYCEYNYNIFWYIMVSMNELNNGVIGESEAFSSDPYDFQEAMKDVPEFGQGLAKNTYERYNEVGQRINITSESICHYIDDRRQDNFDRINRRNKPFLANVYKNIVQENPILKNIIVVDEDIEGNAYYSCASAYSDGQVLPTVNFNFSNTETYLRPENMQEGDNFGLEYVLKTIALKTGAKPSEIMRNERLVTSFIMLHEFGHALDFQKNYLGAELDKLEGKGKGVRALPGAISKNQEDRLRDLMSQPIPGQVSADNYLELVVPFARRLEAFGINPHDSKEVIDNLHKGYREMNSESFADNFATDYIMRHYDDFFEKPDSGGSSTEKVKTHVGELMKINRNMDILGLVESKAVRMTKVELMRGGDGRPVIMPGNPPRVNEGFLARKMKIGEGISLLKEDDPTSRKRYQESPNLRNIYIRPRKDEHGNVKNDIIVQMSNGRNTNRNEQDDSKYYLVEATGVEPREIDVPAEEMMNRFKLGVGSKVMLMKRELESDSGVMLGSILGGRFEKPAYFQGDSPIQVGKHGIHLSSSAGEKTGVKDLVDPDFMRGGNTTVVERVYRKWKSYYVETETSTYEVIPYK